MHLRIRGIETKCAVRPPPAETKAPAEIQGSRNVSQQARPAKLGCICLWTTEVKLESTPCGPHKCSETTKEKPRAVTQSAGGKSPVTGQLPADIFLVDYMDSGLCWKNPLLHFYLFILCAYLHMHVHALTCIDVKVRGQLMGVSPHLLPQGSQG